MFRIGHRAKITLAIALVIAGVISVITLLFQHRSELAVRSQVTEFVPLTDQGDFGIDVDTAPASTPISGSNLRKDEKFIVSSAWAAHSGNEVLNATRSSELVNSRLNMLLYMIRASCKVAVFRAAKLKNPVGALEANQKLAVKTFLVNYCGDVSNLESQITQRLGPDNSAFKARQYDEETILLLAAKPSKAVADALINEVLLAPDVDLARVTAPLIADLTKKGGPLDTWQEFLPENPSFSDQNIIFTVAGEIIGCQQHHGCGPNQILSMYQCLMERGCKPNEDLLSYRRRTTSPMLYQAAEQIAAAMQARRYR